MLSLMKSLSMVWQQRKADQGQGMVEYALLVALIAIVVIAALLLLGPQIAQIFTDITNQL